MQKYQNATVKEVLEWAEKQNFSSFQPQYSSLENPSKSYEILEIKNIQHPSLIQYLQARKLESQKSQLEEIHYKLNGRNYFGLGFKNDSGGYEIRNPHIKICLGKKAISTIKKESTSIRIFEGFTDYLSFRILEKPLEKSPSDYLILNSVSMIKRTTEMLRIYPNIELFLDNDRTGDDATQLLQKEFPYAQDNRFLYQHCKDLNEFLTTSEIPEQRRRKIGR
ncbi:toprim domain-containing protein [Daejeonia sp. YH14]|uniref:toprim domain-containing protein n=1 Tax=Daejeonia sp. YH14 TaxID=3439042 RepID=UPI003F493D1E